MTYADCPDTATPWGEVCGTCHQRLPEDKGALSSWASQRPLLFASGSSAGLGTRATSRPQIGPRRKRAPTTESQRFRLHRSRPPRKEG